MAKILVGAIDRNTRELIVFSLRFAGHGLLSAANREECLNLARQNKPDVILVDNNIAGMGGDEFSKELKSSGETANMPLILLISNEIAENTQVSKIGEEVDTIGALLCIDQLTDKVNKVTKRLKK